MDGFHLGGEIHPAFFVKPVVHGFDPDGIAACHEAFSVHHDKSKYAVQHVAEIRTIFFVKMNDHLTVTVGVKGMTF